MCSKNDFNLFVGGYTGAFKGLNIATDNIITKNLQNTTYVDKTQQITSMVWSEPDEQDILIATANRTVKVYDTDFKAYAHSLEMNYGDGPIVGIFRYKGSICACSQSGHIKILKYPNTQAIEINLNGSVDRMKNCLVDQELIAAGGKQNDLKVWNLEQKQTIFNAKNVAKDHLDLEVPIWVSDLSFLPDSSTTLVTVGRHGHVRLYDTKVQRRPVANIDIPNQSFTSLALCSMDRQLIAGSGTGHMLRLDLRMKKVVNSYKGAVGSIRQIACSSTEPIVASVGLDRNLRIHNIESGKILVQLYLKVKLNCVLLRSKFSVAPENTTQDVVNTLKKPVQPKDKDEDVVKIIDDEYEQMFEEMDTVGEKRKFTLNDNVLKKKVKNV